MERPHTVSPRAAGVAQRIGPYHLITRLDPVGAGLPAVSERRFIARGPDRDRTVLLSAPHATTDPERFAVEARAARHLMSPGVSQVTEVSEHANSPWYTTAYLPVLPLPVALAVYSGPLPEATVRAVGAALAEVLATAHSLGITHAGVSPAAVLLAGTVHVWAASARYGSLRRTARNAPVCQVSTPAASPRNRLLGAGHARPETSTRWAPYSRTPPRATRPRSATNCPPHCDPCSRPVWSETPRNAPPQPMFWPNWRRFPPLRTAPSSIPRTPVPHPCSHLAGFRAGSSRRWHASRPQCSPPTSHHSRTDTDALSPHP